MSEIPFSVRDKNVRINAISGMNFEDTKVNRLIKKIDENNAGNSNISNLHTSTGSKTTFLSGDPDDIFSIIGGVIETETTGFDREMTLSVTNDHVLKIFNNNPISVTGGFDCLDGDINVNSGDINALVGTVTAQDVTATGSLTGTLATDEQPNIRRIAERLSFINQGTGEKLVMVDDSAFWIVNSHALSSGVTHFNYIGQPRVNSISGTTEFTDNAYFLGEINGTLATTAQPNITSVGTLTSLTSSGTVSAQDVTATGVLTGTLASIPQPNITRIGPGLDFTETGKVTIDNLTELKIENRDGTSTHFNIGGFPKLNYVRGTTEFASAVFCNDFIHGTLAINPQPYITRVGANLDLQADRVVVDNTTEFRIVNDDNQVTHFNLPQPTAWINYIRGHTEFTSYVFFRGGSSAGSDDRLKHNEQIITNGLSVMSQLTPKKYDKTQVLMDANYNGALEEGEYTKEAGLIAQELLETDISFVVKIPENLETDPYGVDYNSVFTYAISAIKELHVLVQSQATTINELQVLVQSHATTIKEIKKNRPFKKIVT